MTATSETTKRNGSPARAELRAPTIATPRGRRRPAFVVAGIAMVVIGALAAVWLVTSAGHRTDVVAMARDVPYGETITADDLTTTAVSVDAIVPTIPAGEARAVIGHVAARALSEGSLLARSDVTSEGVVGSGQVLVPVPLTVERVPAGGLAVGEDVLVIDAPPQGADPMPGTPQSFEATVARVGEPDINGLVVADLVANAADGPALAARAATGRFALVVLPAEGSK